RAAVRAALHARRLRTTMRIKMSSSGDAPRGRRSGTRGLKNERDFTRFLAQEIVQLGDLCTFCLKMAEAPEFPCRDFLSLFHREAARLEELVDGHGAQNNEKWFPFRESIAAAKLFSSVTYEVLHIKQGMRNYRLLGIESGHRKATDEVIGVLTRALVSVCRTLLSEIDRCRLRIEEHTPRDFEPCATESSSYRLPADREVRHTERVGETVVYLATRFLNLSEDGEVQDVLAERPAEDFARVLPEPMSEERLRTVEAGFHNLQSLYDTYIFETDIEEQDGNLPLLRGHVSMIYHLLAAATQLAHYYIRHMSSLRRDTFLNTRFPLTPNTLRHLLFTYPLHFARLYQESAVQLCQSMIRAYSVQTSVEVPIPNYRGFHVRPSTLVAKIVAHYGSPVTMKLGDEKYDAGSPLDLFRANEAINAAKRRRVADMLNRQEGLQTRMPSDKNERIRELQLLFVRLMNEGAIVLYDAKLSFNDLQVEDEATLAEIAARYVVHLMSIAKMDIRSDMSVTFIGDSRALHDLQILAENGYGEDDMGNNIVLPEELSYLSR
ncbi:MAG: HPr family phosphocarrier protein, partial [Spirochaetaceae bacterium]